MHTRDKHTHRTLSLQSALQSKPASTRSRRVANRPQNSVSALFGQMRSIRTGHFVNLEI